MSSATLSSCFQERIPNDPSLSLFIRIIPHMSLASRKQVLSLCRTQTLPPGEANRTVDQIIHDLRIRQENVASYKDIREAIKSLTKRSILRSVISMWIRNEAFDALSNIDEMLVEGFEKEWRAGQHRRSETSTLDYDILDSENFHPPQYSIFYPLTPSWSGYAKNLVGRFASRLDRIGTIFPSVQRSKNMSYGTARELFNQGYVGNRPWNQFRTLDLELHKMVTGEEVQGPCEMRMAWKFNDLKPRFYYCVGGTSYWKSRYMKRIAVELMESIDSTKLNRREHPEDIHYYTDDADHICIWDMTSFSTSLSELKYFLYYIGRGLQDDLRVQQKPLRCLDYAEGIIEITADKLLLEYNEQENHEAPFTTWRVLDKLYQNHDDTEVFSQKNSGMLGVLGNIGFSTAFHGFHLEAGIRKGAGCSVGDDAIAGMDEDPRERFIPHMQQIGTLHPDKADILEPLQPWSSRQESVFMKRPLYRDHHGLSRGILLSFPSLADIYHVEDGYHTSTRKTIEEVTLAFIGHVGAFFWDLFAIGDIDEEDKAAITTILHMTYSKLGLRPSGSLPGFKHRLFKDGLPVAVPSLYHQFAIEDWAEVLWDRNPERYALLPVMLGPTALPPYCPGYTFLSHEGGLVNVLVDVGCIEELSLVTEWVATIETNRRIFRGFLEGAVRTRRYRYCNSCPSWFDSVVRLSIDVPWLVRF